MDKIEIICTVIGAIASILAGVWFIIRKAQKSAVNDFRLDNMEKDVSLLKSDVSLLKSDMAIVKENMGILKDTLEDNNDILISISEWIMRKDAEMIGELTKKITKKKQNTLVMKGSPYRLTEQGEKLFAEVNGKEFLQKNKEMFFSLIGKRTPKTAYDVEKAAQYALYFSTHEDIFNPIKDYVYNAPPMIIKDEDGTEERQDITLEDICYVLSIPLRDMYLEEIFNKRE